MNTKFVNREGELALVRGLMDAIERGEKLVSPVVHFHGFRGMGKTRLAREVTQLSGSGWVCVFVADVTRFYWSSVELPNLPYLIVIDDLKRGNALSDEIESTIGKLLEADRAVVVSFADYHPAWRSFAIRRRIQVHPLRPFTIEEMAEQLGIEVEDAAEIFHLAGGHPALSLELYNKGATAAVVRDWLEAIIVSGWNRDYRNLFHLLGTAPRSFLWTTLEVMSSAVTADGEPLSYSRVASLIGGLVEFGLARFSVKDRGYSLTPPLRKILLNCLREADWGSFFLASRLMLRLYGKWCELVFRPDLLAELLFLTAQAERTQEEMLDLWSCWRSVLEEKVWGFDREELLTTRQQLEGTEWRQMVGGEIADAFFKTIDEAIAAKTE